MINNGMLQRCRTHVNRGTCDLQYNGSIVNSFLFIYLIEYREP